MSDTPSLESRVGTIESNLNKLESVVTNLANVVQEQGEHQRKSIEKLYDLNYEQHQELMGENTRLAVEHAQRGQISSGTIIGIIATLISTVGLIITVCVVVGSLAIAPMRSDDIRMCNDIQQLQLKRVENISLDSAQTERIKNNEFMMSLLWKKVYEQDINKN